MKVYTLVKCVKVLFNLIFFNIVGEIKQWHSNKIVKVKNAQNGFNDDQPRAYL